LVKFDRDAIVFVGAHPPFSGKQHQFTIWKYTFCLPSSKLYIAIDHFI
jgi:hypothetical protein